MLVHQGRRASDVWWCGTVREKREGTIRGCLGAGESGGLLTTLTLTGSDSAAMSIVMR